MSNSTSINDADTLPPPAPKPMGFAWLKANRPGQLREIASKGGRAAHGPDGTAHEWSSDEAREAGRKGGRATAAKRKANQEWAGKRPGEHPRLPVKPPRRER